MIRWVAGISIVLLAGCNPPPWNFGTSGNASGTSSGSERRSFFGSSDSDKEEWHILCGKYDGPDRMRVADELAAALKRVSGVDAKRVHVVHEDRVSRITYGPYMLGYTEQGNVVFTPQMNNDLQLIRSLSVNDQFPFFTALKEPAPTPDVGPPEWDLRKANGMYTLLIGVFYNTPKFHERKQAAVEWVKDLRGRGYEAFYYHGTKYSHVTVGSFDRSAVITQRLESRDREFFSPQGPIRDYSPEVIKLRQNPELTYFLINGAKELSDKKPTLTYLVLVPHSEDDVNLDTMKW